MNIKVTLNVAEESMANNKKKTNNGSIHGMKKLLLK
jgi:hypothetical protein